MPTQEAARATNDRSVPRSVWAYIATVAALAVAAWFAPLAPVMPAAEPLVATIALLACVIVASQVATSASNPHGPRRRIVVMDSMFEFAAILLLPWHSIVALVVLKNAAAASGGRRRFLWYQTVFNTAEGIVTSGLTMFVSRALWAPAESPALPTSWLVLGASLGTAYVYCRSNDILVAGVIALDAGGKSFSAKTWRLSSLRPSMLISLVGLPTTLAATLTSLLGLPVALLWNLDPWYALPMAIPLKLAYDALRIPELERSAVTDARTVLANLRGFDAQFGDELKRAERFARPISLVMLDLDHFKAVNDTYGHPTGDSMLTQLGSIIAEELPPYDIAARIGGEEFAIALPEVGLDGATLFAERLRSRVAAAEFAGTAAVSLHITVSMGVATFPANGRSRAELVAQADAALYEAKDSRRNRVAARRNGSTAGV